MLGISEICLISLYVSFTFPLQTSRDIKQISNISIFLKISPQNPTSRPPSDAAQDASPTLQMHPNRTHDTVIARQTTISRPKMHHNQCSQTDPKTIPDRFQTIPRLFKIFENFDPKSTQNSSKIRRFSAQLSGTFFRIEKTPPKTPKRCLKRSGHSSSYRVFPDTTDAAFGSCVC